MAALWMFSFGPELFYRYKGNANQGELYNEGRLESYSTRTINCLRASWNFCYYFSPMIMLMLHRRGTLTSADGPPYLMKVVSIAVGVYYLAHLTRGIGRMSNSAYKAFSAELKQVKNGALPNSTLTKYDFTFTSWPVDFSVKQRSSPVQKKVKVVDPKLTFADRLKLIPTELVSYLAANSFARWLIYPGSTSLLNAMVEPALLEGRRKLVENHNGRRYKLETYDGNLIDSIFIDKRHDGTDNGNILVITSEGNAAFYEAGCMEAPLTRGYSILGWNHPGFGASTGSPYPDQEHNAIDTVVQFALNELNFTIDQIVFFSWSIGGFASTWAASHYPECKALILDATFDDILPLARNRMPLWMGSMVEMTVRRYFDLDNSKWLNEYGGPVKLIRRTQDEMISLNPADVRTNRGNLLLMKTLSHRYPHLFNKESQSAVKWWLSLTQERKDGFLDQQNVDKDECYSTLMSLSEECGHTIPMTSGEFLEQEVKTKLSLYLADRYLVDVASTHCTPLPPDVFELPWQLQYM